jgi:hypothetical protein
MFPDISATTRCGLAGYFTPPFCFSACPNAVVAVVTNPPEAMAATNIAIIIVLFILIPKYGHWIYILIRIGEYDH